MEFNTKEKCNEFFSCPGNQFENLYDSKVEKDGTVRLVVSGKKDIQQEIDSWLDHTDMSYILKAMAAGTYVPPVAGQYADISKMPKDMTEAMQIQLNAEKAFYDLDLKTRNKFDNDYRKWLVLMNSDADMFSDLMGFTKDNVDVKETSDVSE